MLELKKIGKTAFCTKSYWPKSLLKASPNNRRTIFFFFIGRLSWSGQRTFPHPIEHYKYERI